VLFSCMRICTASTLFAAAGMSLARSDSTSTRLRFSQARTLLVARFRSDRASNGA
jgi:hypothetical protein